MNKGKRWTDKNHDILVFYLSRYADGGITIESVAEYTEREIDSVKMRIRNFRWLDGKSGLCNPASLSKEVYREYGKYDQAKLKEKCLEILGKKSLE